MANSWILPLAPAGGELRFVANSWAFVFLFFFQHKFP